MKRAVTALAVLVFTLLALGAFWRPAHAPSVLIHPPEEPDPRLFFVGDIMFDRAVARHAEASTAPLFAGVLGLFKVADANVANLEGPITLNSSIASRDVLHFTFEPELARQALVPLRLAAASQANNHAYDFGIGGFRSTQWYLTSWGIASFGHPYNATSSLSTIIDIRGKKFCLVGYHALYNPDASSVVNEITRLKSNCYRVVVMAHWGDEYAATSSPLQQSQAHELVDAGADLIIGAHPHVVQNVEVYKGKAVFYSLGNFMFDQNFSWAVQHGLAVKVTFGAASTRFELTPISVINEEARVANEPDKQRVLEAAGRLAQWSLP